MWGKYVLLYVTVRCHLLCIYIYVYIEVLETSGANNITFDIMNKDMTTSTSTSSSSSCNMLKVS